MYVGIHVPSVIGTATPELVFTATTDAAKWVQIYGLLRPTDANDVFNNNWHRHLAVSILLYKNVSKLGLRVGYTYMSKINRIKI